MTLKASTAKWSDLQTAMVLARLQCFRLLSDSSDTLLRPISKATEARIQTDMLIPLHDSGFSTSALTVPFISSSSEKTGRDLSLAARLSTVSVSHARPFESLSEKECSVPSPEDDVAPAGPRDSFLAV